MKFCMLSGEKTCKSCRSRQELSNESLVFTCTIWLRCNREQASQSLPKISQKLEEKLEKTQVPAHQLLYVVRHERDAVRERLVRLLEAPDTFALGLDLRLRGLDLLAHLLDHLLVFDTESVRVFDEIGLRALDGGHSGVGLGLRVIESLDESGSFHINSVLLFVHGGHELLELQLFLCPALHHPEQPFDELIDGYSP